MKKYISFLVILLPLFSIYSYSIDSYKFRTFSPKGGFYYDGVKSIVQDGDGFMWVMMDNEIWRFDGYEYKRYSAYFRNLNIAGIWSFNSMAKDPAGNLYIATNNGLFTYNTLSDSFDRIYDENITTVSVDKQNDIWVIYERQLCKLDRKTKELHRPLYKNKPVNNIGRFEVGEDDMYMATYYNRIYYYNKQQPDTVSLFYLFPESSVIVGMKRAGDKLWVLLRDKGILKIDIATKQIEETFESFYKPEEENVPVKAFFVDKKGKAWIGTQRGLYVLDPDTKKYQIFLHSKSDIYSLPNNSVWTITSDSQQNIWIGTYSGGLCYVNLDETLHFTTYTSSESSLNHSLVSSFAEDENYLWIGTEGGGVNCMDKKTGEFTSYKHKPGQNSLAYNNVKSLHLDKDKNLWIAMYMGGLNCFDTKTKQFHHYKFIQWNKKTILSNSIRKIIPEGDEGLWIVYQINKVSISYLSFADKSITHYPIDDKSSSYIFDIHRGNNNDLWIITHEKLYCMDVKTHSVKDISLNGISDLNAQTINIDADNNIWIGTIGKGLIKYNVKTSEATTFGKILDYNISTIYSICPDEEKNLWLGTDNGLFRYNVNDNSYLKFDENDGLQGQVYYPLASMRSYNGKLYFGGTNGFTIVDPHNIGFNNFKPKVIISDFFVDNVSTNPPLRDDGNEIVLDYTQANFGFKFSSDNYLAPNKSQFRYRLQGYDERWITVDANNRMAMYSKVPAGTYFFEIQAANNDGVWSDMPTIIKIERKPAPWFSWPAYLLYSIIILAILAGFAYYYNEKRKLKMQLYLDNVDKQKREELHQSQLRFFTNISHDFRTPLSLILATVENLKQEGIKEYYHRILNNNARRLLNLVNELMDFRTVENGKMKLQVQSFDLNSFVKELSHDFDDYARKRNIKYEILCDPDMPQSLYADKQIVEKVVLNLLNNAFKYTKENGYVSITTYWDKNKFPSRYKNSFLVGDVPAASPFLIVVRDTGIGISKESIASVFERFYKVKTANIDSHLGTGIGLALVKSLVLLHKGSITIYSEREEGTDMVVCLSADSSQYDSSEFYDNDAVSVRMVEEQESLVNEEEAAVGDMGDILFRDKKRIMIVEDNNDLRALLVNFLSQHFETEEATNGVEASQLLENMEFDLIISDIMMPLKDGVTLCKEVKSDVNTSHIPFVLLTAKSDLESKLEGVDSGADLYFEKPIDFSLLLLSVQNIFKHQQSLREFYSKNYFVDSAELSSNEQDNAFLKKLVDVIDVNLTQPNIDVNFIASELSMSRSKLYSKVKTLTDKSIVEFILNYKLRKAARMIIEQDMSMRQIMEEIGMKSQSYFTNAFKKEFGDTPSTFAAKHKNKKD